MLAFCISNPVNDLYLAVTNSYNHAFINHVNYQNFYCQSYKNSEDITAKLRNTSLEGQMKFIIGFTTANELTCHICSILWLKHLLRWESKLELITVIFLFSSFIRVHVYFFPFCKTTVLIEKKHCDWCLNLILSLVIILPGKIFRLKKYQK